MRIGVYVRVSTEEQSRGLSLEEQERACRDYAEREAWDVVAVWRDVQSGLEADRPGWQELLAEARRKRFDGVLVYRLDRFGREPADAFPAIKELARLNVKLYSASEGNEPLVQGLLLLLAQEESRRTSARVQLVMKGMAKQGKWMTRAPLGYDVVPAPDGKGSTLRPNAQAPLVRRLFELYAGPASYRDLQDEAAAMGLTLHGRIIDRQRIQHILRNAVYVGRVRYNRRAHGQFTGNEQRSKAEWIDAPGLHEPLIDEKIWARVQVRLAENRGRNTAGEKTDYLLTSYLFCARCGGRMHGQKVHRYSRKTGKRTGKTSHLYRCYKGVQLGACDLKYVSGPRVDAAVRQAIKQVPRFPLESGTLGACILIEEALGEGAARERQVKRLKAERSRHDKRRVNLTRDYYDRKGTDREIPEDVFDALMREAENAIKAIDAELETNHAVDERKLLAVQAMLDRPVDAPTPWPDDQDLEGWRWHVERYVDRVEVRSLDDVCVTPKPEFRYVVEAVKRGESMPPEIREALIRRVDKVLARLREHLEVEEGKIAEIERSISTEVLAEWRKEAGA